MNSSPFDSGLGYLVKQEDVAVIDPNRGQCSVFHKAMQCRGFDLTQTDILTP